MMKYKTSATLVVGLGLAASAWGGDHETHQKAGDDAKEIKFSEFDQNNDQRIDQGEFATIKSSPDVPQNVELEMYEFDENQNNQLDEQEFAELQDKVRRHSSEQTAINSDTDALNQTETVGTAVPDADASDIRNSAVTPDRQGDESTAAATPDEPADQTAANPSDPTNENPAVSPDDSQQTAKNPEDPTNDPAMNPSTRRDTANTPDVQSPEVRVSAVDFVGVTVGEIAGKAVSNAAGEKIGRVQDVVRANTGGQVGVALKSGGFLGVGESDIFVSLDQLTMQGEDLVWQTTLDEKQVKKIGGYKNAEYTVIKDKSTSLSDLMMAE